MTHLRRVSGFAYGIYRFVMTKKPSSSPSSRTGASASEALLAERIRAARMAKNLEPADLDRRIDARPGTVARIEAGDRKLFAGDLYRLAQALDAPIDSFFPTPDLAATPAEPDETAVSAAEAAAFAEAYQRVTNPKVRKQISDLIKSVAARERSDEPSSP